MTKETFGLSATVILYGNPNQWKGKTMGDMADWQTDQFEIPWDGIGESEPMANNNIQKKGETMAFSVNLTSGKVETFETLDAAKAHINRLYPEAEIGHAGDLEDGGDRTLCWENEQDSVNDAGQKAIANITVSV